MLKRVAVLLALAATSPVVAQDPTQPVETGWEWFGLPTLNFDSDEGFGYGALLQLYNYGDGGAKPYRFMVRPVVLFTTKGRREFSIELDAPHLLPAGWRLDAVGGYDKYLQPYYGIGNDTEYDEALEEAPNDFYYRYERRQFRFGANVQRDIAATARLLLGIGYGRVKTDATPEDSGTTLLNQQLQASQGVADVTSPEGGFGFVRIGAVLDTRDQEIGPRRGHWIDALVQLVPSFGSRSPYARYTITGRKYVSLTSRLVYAQRIAGQVTSGPVPFFDLSSLQTITGQTEALGGTSSVRGVPKNRFIGRGLAFSNSELRYRVNESKLMGKPAHLVLSAFVDAGRVWPEGIETSGLLSDYHVGYGGGLRLGLGPSFLVAFDMGRWNGFTQIYIGLGYPF